MSEGRILVYVFGARASVPIKDAEVFIYDENKNKIFSLVTNEDGLTEKVLVPTPNKDLSLDEQNIERPYALYNVRVEAPGYIPKNIVGIQVFDEQEAIVPIVMLPVPAKSTFSLVSDINMSDSENVVDDFVEIPKHQLHDEQVKGEKNQQRSEENGQNGITPFILNQVAIPEYIVVHLGKPNEDAENVWVSFPEYIKNVASSEIYPTWPENSLRANILAQISLALNRIYTEWYRSKGYDFQITSSTQFDQKFIKDRNIFLSIDRIVDEIFNEYVVKPGSIEPYYTEYCDGKKVSCAGMKQWGTVTLAKDGLTPEEILEFYYGPLNIIETNQIKGIPSSYSGVPLKLGSEGEDVEKIQGQLNRINKNYPGIPRSKITGFFDKETEASVKAFQEVFNLQSDGIVGKSTWYKISYIYSSVKRLAQLDSEGQRPEIKPGQYPGYVLKIGSFGDNVKTIQYILNLMSLYYYEIQPVAIDGYFGKNTKSAIEQFQKIFELDVDGIVGKKTWSKLLDIYKGIYEDVNIPNSTYPGVLIGRGSKGINVEKVQTYLNTANIAFKEVPKVIVDGDFGVATENSVKAFQEYFGINVDGVVGPTTWNALIDVYYSILRNDFYGGKTLKYGDTGSDVRIMQTMLRDIENFDKDASVLSASGDFKDSTENSVIDFQGEYGLVPNGEINKKDWYLITYVHNKVKSTPKNKDK